jgi:DNA-directed RNA polymerase specialized sigma24 family protein
MARAPPARLAGTGDRPAVRNLVNTVGPAMLRATRKPMGNRAASAEDVLRDTVEGVLLRLPIDPFPPGENTSKK